MKKNYLVWGLLYGLLAVVIGAFGAHALKSILSAEQQQSFETGVRYQMYHALLLIILSKFPVLTNKWILNMLVVGIFLFSFSIYLLNIGSYLKLDFIRFLGPVTPIGGLLLILVWGILTYRAITLSSSSSS